MAAETSFEVATLPLMKNCELLVVALSVRRTVTFLPFGPLSSISMEPVAWPIFTKELTSAARPKVYGSRLIMWDAAYRE